MTDQNTRDDSTQDERDEQIAQLEEDLAKMTDAAKRTMADFQNFKRRTEEERGELQVFANIKLLEAIFPALDNMARAMDQIPEELKANDWVKGVSAIEDSLMNTLKNLGLEPINQTGVPVDPNQHEVLMEGDGPAGEVVQIFEKGYHFKGKTVRAAKVMVGKG